MPPSGKGKGRARPLPPRLASQLVTSFAHFLTVAIHNILYYRSLYPQTTFLKTQAYNLAVHQSRHPAVCAWVRDAVDAVKAQLIKGTVSRIAIVIHERDTRVRERWMLDVAAFPAWPQLDEAQNARRDESGKGKEPEEGDDHTRRNSGGVNWSDVDEGLRTALFRMALASEKMSPLPEGSSFTVAVELRDASEAPIDYPQHWIPSQPSLQTQSKKRPRAGSDIGGDKTIPVRTVEAGPLFFQCWVEEGAGSQVADSFASAPSA